MQVERVVTIMQNPRQYKIPDWFLNRQKDVKDGKYSQVRIACLFALFRGSFTDRAHNTSHGLSPLYELVLVLTFTMLLS